MGEQIAKLISSVSTLTVVTILAVIVITIAALAVTIFITFFGSQSKVENVMDHYNRALSAWCAFALREELQNAYPVGIEIEADKAPFGIIVKKVTVVVKTGFRESRYKMLRADQNFVQFEKDEE